MYLNSVSSSLNTVLKNEHISNNTTDMPEGHCMVSISPAGALTALQMPVGVDCTAGSGR